MKESQVLDIVTDAGYMINEDAVLSILSQKNPNIFLKNLLKSLDSSVFIIDYKSVCEFIKTSENASFHPLHCSEIDFSSELTPKFPFEDNVVEIISDVTGHSTSVGEYSQFVKYFRDRYTKISDMIRCRVNAKPIESLSRSRFLRSFSREEGSDITIIGLVSEKNTTNNQHLITVLEDPTGTFPVLFNKNDTELIEQASSLVLDEVVGITGKLSGDGGILMASRIVRPDIPNMFKNRNLSLGYAVFISDVHIGSKEFMKDEWEFFIDFLNGRIDNPDLLNLASQIRYLVIAGDLVDGIGVYPSQDLDLEILDIHGQYKEIARYLSQVPSNIHIVIGPGNHDVVRRAEPQPALPENIRKYFSSNVTFVGNPALVSLDGVRVLMYHGCSMDDMVATIKGVSYEEPTTGMVEMIKRRHLAPLYGGRVVIAPESKDYLVIDEIPDIMHCGHVHTIGIEYYKNILLLNSGTWQAQTDFQRKVNIHPSPAKIPIVNLKTLRAQYIDFNLS